MSRTIALPASFGSMNGTSKIPLTKSQRNSGQVRSPNKPYFSRRRLVPMERSTFSGRTRLRTGFRSWPSTRTGYGRSCLREGSVLCRPLRTTEPFYLDPMLRMEILKTFSLPAKASRGLFRRAVKRNGHINFRLRLLSLSVTLEAEALRLPSHRRAVSLRLRPMGPVTGWGTGSTPLQAPGPCCGLLIPGGFLRRCHWRGWYGVRTRGRRSFRPGARRHPEMEIYFRNVKIL